MQAVTDRLKNFLQYVAVNLIDEPGQAQLKVAELGPKRLRFKLVLAKQDVAMLIGRNGFTASAIRSMLKAAAEREGVQVSLQIHSHEEEVELLARGEAH
ncbi:MAG: KH domain-containing protein [Verrucomicrobiota bacterium]